MLRMLLLLALLPAPASAQVAGHGSVPSAGPAAQEHARPKRDDDPVVSRIDRLRSDLADIARRYRKVKAEERPALAKRLVPVLDEMTAELKRMESGSTQGGVR